MEIELQNTYEQLNDFGWISYSCDQEVINYIDQLISQSQAQQKNINFDKLDLKEINGLQMDTQKHFKNNIADAANDVFIRMQKYGDIKTQDKIAKKTGAINKKGAINQKDLDYYDLDDDFIDDDDACELQQMQIFDVKFEDFFVNQGTPMNLLQTQQCKQRVELGESRVLTNYEYNQIITKGQKKQAPTKRKPKEQKEQKDVKNNVKKRNKQIPALQVQNTIMIISDDEQNNDNLKRKRIDYEKNNQSLLQQIQANQISIDQYPHSQ